PRMTEFLYPERAASIRLDEIDWGGVKINGIVPLDQPAVVAAEQAGFMADADVVFGVE
ncbi:MAG: hypothetical protein GTO30_09830, partial [Acidobacteria bacterium]|nr:hypothetical protein [Acidobacteriota bacterium]